MPKEYPQIMMKRKGHWYVRLPLYGSGYDEIVSDPKVQGGMPCIRGTRIPAIVIYQIFKDNEYTVKQIAKMYKPVTTKQIQAAIDYVEGR